MQNQRKNIFPINQGTNKNKSEAIPNPDVDYYPLPLSNTEKKDILLVKIQNKKFDHTKANSFIAFMKEKLISEYKLVVFDFSECVFMDSIFLGAVIVILKLITSKKLSACLILDIEKFTTLHSVQYSINKLKDKVNIFSTIQQVEDYFKIENLENHTFVLSKVV